MSDQILITGGTLIDGTGAEPVPTTDVLVEPDRIVAVGGGARGAAEPDAAVVDAAGKTVLPGQGVEGRGLGRPLVDPRGRLRFGASLMPGLIDSGNPSGCVELRLTAKHRRLEAGR